MTVVAAVRALQLLSLLGSCCCSSHSVAGLPPSQQAPATTFFVSPTGSDGAAGTSVAAAFRTLHRARDAVRAMPRPLPAGGVSINLTAGVHYGVGAGRHGNFDASVAGVPLQLSAADSGAAHAPIVWRAHGGGDVTVSAGLRIPAAALAPSAHHPGALEANLTALGLTDLGAVGRPPTRPSPFLTGRPLTVLRLTCYVARHPRSAQTATTRVRSSLQAGRWVSHFQGSPRPRDLCLNVSTGTPNAPGP
jgi:hypothetical protein